MKKRLGRNGLTAVLVFFVLGILAFGLILFEITGIEPEKVDAKEPEKNLISQVEKSDDLALPVQNSEEEIEKTETSDVEEPKMDTPVKQETATPSSSSSSDASKDVSSDSKNKTTETATKKNEHKNTTSSSKTETSSSDKSNQKTESKSESSTPAVEKDTTAPVISGVKNRTITKGQSFDKMDGVSAKDNKDGNITSRIRVEGNVDVNSSGKYKLKYTVSDNAGNSASKSATITVVEPEPVVSHESGLENELFNAINSYRQNNGIEAIQYSDVQYSKANSLAKSKAETNTMDSSHYANEISIIYSGSRPSASTLLNMWIASPTHNDFLLNSRKHYGGCAVYRNGNNYYVIMEARIDNR